MSSIVASKAQQTAIAVQGGQGTDESQYLTFLLRGEMFSIGILNIKEIIEFGQITEVPMMPELIRGVINLRGSVVPVIDLSVRFGRTRTEVNKRTSIVIIEVEADGHRQDVGVMVDAVSAVLQIPASEIEPAPSFGARIRSDFILGMGKVDGKFVIILDADRVFSVDEMALIEKVAATENVQA